MNPRAVVVFVVLLLRAVPAGSSPLDTYPRQPGIDVEHYAFHLVLSDRIDRIEGRADVTVHLTRSGVDQLRLDLVQASARHGGKGMAVHSVQVDGSPARFLHDGDVLTLALPAGLEAGTRITVQVGYRGIPADGLRIGPNRHGDRTFFGDNWPDR
ncbi:MAG: M1 family peptidase, partial [Gemmatimonadota bacterium]|nr:M1 family peptidase [Gemmatimonadota bacterium]